MNNKKILGLIFIVLIIIIILITCILLLINSNNTDNTNNEIYSSSVINNKIEIIDNKRFFTVSKCISTYISELNKNNSKYYGENEQIVDESYIKQNIYNLLSEEYIKNNSITVQNVYDYVYDIKEQLIFVPLQINLVNESNIEQYVAYGCIINGKNEFVKEIYLGVNLDTNNMTFSIEQYKENYSNINDIKISKLQNSIEKKDNNTYTDAKITDEFLIGEYLKIYKRLSLSKPELAYNYLDYEYRTLKFNNFAEYKSFVEKNRSNILKETMSKYQVNKIDDYTQYICITESGNYYIFKESKNNKFSVILDTYTIDLPEYIEKYNKSTNQEKVGLCIDKFIKNVNAENYNLAYSMLSEGFKNNYFKTLDDFKNYAKQYFLGTKVTFKTVESEADVYIYEVKLTKNETNSIDKNFNVKLGKGTNFEMSFNID